MWPRRSRRCDVVGKPPPGIPMKTAMTSDENKHELGAIPHHVQVVDILWYLQTLRFAQFLHGGFLKWGYLYLQIIIHFKRTFPYKPSILGIPHLWKPPHQSSVQIPNHTVFFDSRTVPCRPNAQMKTARCSPWPPGHFRLNTAIGLLESVEVALG